MSENNLTIVSALVLVDQDGRVLICERPKGKFMEGFWEFPGGKLEKNETPENCLVREIKEEIGVNLKNVCFSPLTFSLNKYDNFNILLLLYICQEYVGVVSPNENQNMKSAMKSEQPRRASLEDYEAQMRELERDETLPSP